MLLPEISGVPVGFLIRNTEFGPKKITPAMHGELFVQVLTALFVIANPIGILPVFLSLTADFSPPERRRTAIQTVLTVAVVLTVAALVGEALLQFFGISLPAFRAGGGILILLMAVAMLHARHGRIRHTPEEAIEAEERENIGVVPLGIPMLAGPGAISTVIIYAHQATTWFDKLMLLLAVVTLAGAIWFSLRLAEPIKGWLGQTGINIITRILGLLLVAISVEFIVEGIAALWQGV